MLQFHLNSTYRVRKAKRVDTHLISRTEYDRLPGHTIVLHTANIVPDEASRLFGQAGEAIIWGLYYTHQQSPRTGGRSTTYYQGVKIGRFDSAEKLRNAVLEIQEQLQFTGDEALEYNRHWVEFKFVIEE